MIGRIALCSLLLAVCGTMPAAPPKSRQQSDAKKLAGYKVIVVQAFTLAPAAAAKAPQGLDLALHARAVQELQAEALFDGVIDAAPAAPEATSATNGPVDLRVGAARPDALGTSSTQQPSGNSSGERRLILHCAVLSFSNGNRAARYIAGFGAGESKLKVRFTLADADTGAEVMSWEQSGSFKGMFTPFGGSGKTALNGAANGVVKGLIRQIAKNR